MVPSEKKSSLNEPQWKQEYLKLLEQLDVRCPYCERLLETTKIENYNLVPGPDMFFQEVWCHECDTYIFEATPKNKKFINV